MPRIEQLEKLLAADPEDSFLNFAMGMELLKAGRIEEAQARFRGVVARDPGYVAAHAQLAKALIAAGRTDQARSALAAGIEAARRTGDAHAAQEMEQDLRLLG